MNMVFTGNPGTGKTTVARIIADMFKSMGILKKGHIIETDTGGLIAKYMGHTAPKTEEVFRSAIGGVLFIDEAYGLANDAKSVEGGSYLEYEQDDNIYLKGKYIQLYNADPYCYIKLIPDSGSSNTGTYFKRYSKSGSEEEARRERYRIRGDHIYFSDTLLHKENDYVFFDDYLVNVEYLSNNRVPYSNYFNFINEGEFRKLEFFSDGTVKMSDRDLDDPDIYHVKEGTYKRFNEIIKCVYTRENSPLTLYYLVFDGRLSDSVYVNEKVFKKIRLI